MSVRIQPTTLIVEKNTSGHRLYYVRLLAAEAHRRGDQVIVALLSTQADTLEVAVHLSKLPADIRILYVEDLSLESVTRLSNDLDAAVTVVPDGDLFAIDLGRRGRWSGHGMLSILVMREIAQPSPMPGLQYLKSQIRLFFFRRASRLPFVTITLLKAIAWNGRTEFPTAIDPVTMAASDCDARSLREEWMLDTDRYWFAILGAISERKNPRLVAEALSGLPPQRVGFLLAGTCENSTMTDMKVSLDRLRATGVKVVVVDRLLEELELDSAVRAIDCVVLAHSNEGSSGLFGKAVAAGTRVVAAGARSLQRDCAVMSSGSAWVTLDVPSLSGALSLAMASARPNPEFELSVENFTKALL